MIHLPPRLAAALASLWALAVGATTQVAMPSWGHYLITGAGILLAGLGLVPDPGPGAPPSTPAEW